MKLTKAESNCKVNFALTIPSNVNSKVYKRMQRFFSLLLYRKSRRRSQASLRIYKAMVYS